LSHCNTPAAAGPKLSLMCASRAHVYHL